MRKVPEVTCFYDGDCVCRTWHDAKFSLADVFITTFGMCRARKKFISRLRATCTPETQILFDTFHRANKIKLWRLHFRSPMLLTTTILRENIVNWRRESCLIRAHTCKLTGLFFCIQTKAKLVVGVECLLFGLGFHVRIKRRCYWLHVFTRIIISGLFCHVNFSCATFSRPNVTVFIHR